MAENQQTKQTPDIPSAGVPSSGNPSPGDRSAASECRSGGMMGCGMGKKGLKGLLLMAACCGAPVLLLLVLPLVGSALGGLGVSALSTLALLACPVGMALMMWMMMRGQQAGASQQAQPLSVSPSQVASTVPSRPQEAAVREDIPEPGETVVTSSLAQEDVITPPQRVNGPPSVRPTLTDNGQQVAVSTPANGETQPVSSPHE